jgi:16S rRNA (guanine966-N2)-methyltransferase
MKDRVREAIFNLIGPSIKNLHAVDLFAGTGALALEAVSRGARGATMIERHLPTAQVIRENASALGVAEHVEIHAGDVFVWVQRLTQSSGVPWAVFCSPPFRFYTERAGEMRHLLTTVIGRAPAGSVLVVETPRRFDFTQLPRGDQWDARSYGPAKIGILAAAPIHPRHEIEGSDSTAERD